ncbi:ABC transporter permease [Paroceanicella profunda]|uniref:ABC transporter permease n=1 Tax=Paroceanicella profunda TaxID=2579971 RepID=A0A5B8G2G9_9RHOB|nr:ABC transporter permease [Paroceanicella profunda]QDL93352.1 ABC transporter permease [Paroceanicella profunda]
MLLFVLKRLGVMLITALCLTFVVFWLTNLDPNLKKLAKEQANARMTDAQVETWLESHGYRRPMVLRYGEWVAAVAQGDLGTSTVFRKPVAGIVAERLTYTGWLMFWVMVVMVPSALLIGVLAGMREGSRTDRTLSTFSIASTATPEYVSGVILVVLFASSRGGLSPIFLERGTLLKGVATSATEHITFENFALPVATMALYGMGYIARMTRASMAEVMTAQYIRTARLKGVSFANIVIRHALRNALIAPFTVIMLQFPWLLTGVVIVETLFNYKGFGWTLVQAASNNDIELLLSCSIVAVLVVLVTQLISDIGYVWLNPRIRVR